MKQRPIPFTAPMVRALLDGTKTQTRRVVKPQFDNDAEPAEMGLTNDQGHQISGHSGLWWDDCAGNPDAAIRCPYGHPGDQLWVREAWRARSMFDKWPPRNILSNAPIHYEAGGSPAPGDGFWGKLRPPRFMCRWMSRILLEVTAVRVERLQDISESDAASEGLLYSTDHMGHWSGTGEKWFMTARHAYRHLWESINGPNSWAQNPWVWVIEFKRVQP